MRVLPDLHTRFEINLYTDNNDRPLSFRPLSLVWSTFISHNIHTGRGKGVYLTDPNPPFPFVPDQQFSINITATATNVLTVSNCFAGSMDVWMDGLVGGCMYV